MKCIVLQADGVSDEPLPGLGGKTPLEAARTPHLDAMASRGILGLARMIPPGVSPDGEAGSLAVLGYDPARHRLGCAPLEAIAHGIPLRPGDVAFRLQLVTVELGDDGSEFLSDPTGGQPTAEEARWIVADLARALGDGATDVWQGSGYRHGLLWRGGEAGMRTVSPHAIVGKSVAAALPVGPGAERLRETMRVARDVLEMHPVCAARRAAGRPGPNAIWLWGQGGVPQLPPFHERFPLRGRLLAARDLPRGLGQLAGLEVREVPEEIGGEPGLVAAALEAVDARDFVLVHWAIADEMGHLGDPLEKVTSLERFDAEIVGPLLEALAARGGAWRLAVVPGHATPCGLRGHSMDPVPFVVAVAGDEARGRAQKRGYQERDAREVGIFVGDGHTLIERLLRA